MPITTAQLIQTLFSTVIVLLLILLLRMLRNGGKAQRPGMPAAEEPGKGEICIERGKLIERHDTELEHLIKDLEEEKEDRKQFHRDISTNIGNVFKELRRMNGAK